MTKSIAKAQGGPAQGSHRGWGQCAGPPGSGCSPAGQSGAGRAAVLQLAHYPANANVRLLLRARGVHLVLLRQRFPALLVLRDRRQRAVRCGLPLQLIGSERSLS